MCVLLGSLRFGTAMPRCQKRIRNKDLNIPKAPHAFSLFVKACRSQGVSCRLRKKTNVGSLAFISKKWRGLQSSKKKVFVDKAAELKQLNLKQRQAKLGISVGAGATAGVQQAEVQQAEVQQAEVQPPIHLLGSVGASQFSVSWDNRVLTWATTSVCGTGSFGVVVEAVDTSSNEKFAIKCARDADGLQDEFKAFSQAGSHPNLAVVYTYLAVDSTSFLVMQLYDGSLRNWIEKQRAEIVQVQLGSSAAEVRWQIWRQIVRGVGHLHSKNIVHLDLKPANILVVSANSSFVIKIADLGSAGAVGSLQIGDHTCTLFYRPWEAFVEKKLKALPSFDVWSLGCVLFELFAKAQHPLLAPFVECRDDGSHARLMFQSCSELCKACFARTDMRCWPDVLSKVTAVMRYCIAPSSQRLQCSQLLLCFRG